MTEVKLWKIQSNETTGWQTIEEEFCTNLTREQCATRIDQLMMKGWNPNRLRAVPNNTPER